MNKTQLRHLELAAAVPGFVSLATWGPVSARAGIYRGAKGHELVWFRQDDEWRLATVNAAGEVLKVSGPIDPHQPEHAGGERYRYGCINWGCILHQHPADVRCRYSANLPVSPNERLVGSALRRKAVG